MEENGFYGEQFLVGGEVVGAVCSVRNQEEYQKLCIK
uniref:Transcriptional regulator n=1 Tax=Meloidogyne hapla TaxID=6305 RepID=A0A1I8BYA4_MELHA